MLQGISAVRCLEWDVLLAVGDSEGLGLILIGCGLLWFRHWFPSQGFLCLLRQCVLSLLSFVVGLRLLGSHLAITRLGWASVIGALVSFAGIPVFQVGSVS